MGIRLHIIKSLRGGRIGGPRYQWAYHLGYCILCQCGECMGAGKGTEKSETYLFVTADTNLGENHTILTRFVCLSDDGGMCLCTKVLFCFNWALSVSLCCLCVSCPCFCQPVSPHVTARRCDDSKLVVSILCQDLLNFSSLLVVPDRVWFSTRVALRHPGKLQKFPVKILT